MRNPVIKIKQVILGILYALLAHLHLNKTDFVETKYSSNALKDYYELSIAKYAGSHFKYRHVGEKG